MYMFPALTRLITHSYGAFRLPQRTGRGLSARTSLLFIFERHRYEHRFQIRLTRGFDAFSCSLHSLVSLGSLGFAWARLSSGQRHGSLTFAHSNSICEPGATEEVDGNPMKTPPFTKVATPRAGPFRPFPSIAQARPFRSAHTAGRPTEHTSQTPF